MTTSFPRLPGRFARAAVILALVAGPCSALAGEPEAPDVPGVVIDHIPASTGIYIGSPTIACLPNGDYVAAHDEFGPNSSQNSSAITHIFRSSDQGRTWRKIATIDGAFWSSLFVNRGALFLIGTTKQYGDFVIRRSTDGGESWTTPSGPESGLLLEGQYHCAPVPITFHEGRLWRGLEDASGGTRWGYRFEAMMISAGADADLLDADSWTATNTLASDPTWLGGDFRGWLEGNAVVTPRGDIVDILRVDAPPQSGTAAMVRISDDGTTARFDPETDWIDFPGGAKKFTIRRDLQTGLYWSLTNIVTPWDAGGNPASIRNTLALVSSPDLRQWEVRSIILYHPEESDHAFQYVDWFFEGEDIVAVSRTAYDDGQGGAHNAHDANYMTFHRIENFRELTMADVPDSWKKAKAAR